MTGKINLVKSGKDTNHKKRTSAALFLPSTIGSVFA
jgi:hypothetical protein